MERCSDRPYKKVFFPRRRGLLLIALALLAPAIVAGWPVDVLEIHFAQQRSESGNTIFLRVPVLLGRDVANTIIHSVERTPVIDEYRVQEGRIWAWREKIKSHNAGLPSLKPERGRFTHEPPWMIIEGTGQSWETLHYRVGTEELGKNVLCLSSLPCLELWREIPGKLLEFSARRNALSDLRFQ